jgi:hypothetical protein
MSVMRFTRAAPGFEGRKVLLNVQGFFPMDQPLGAAKSDLIAPAPAAIPGEGDTVVMCGIPERGIRTFQDLMSLYDRGARGI